MSANLITLYKSILNNNGDEYTTWQNLNSEIKKDPIEFLTYFKNSFKDLNQNSQVLSIDILDYLMDNSNSEFQQLLSEKEFFSFLISLLRMKDIPSLQYKLLGVIEKWGRRFENDKLNPNFTEVYKSLIKNGVSFPSNFKSAYLEMHIFKSSDKNDLFDVSKTNSNNQKHGNDDFYIENDNVTYFLGVNINLDPELFPKKYQIFVGQLKTLLENIKLTNEIINVSDYKQDGLDENVRLVVSNLMDLSSNLVMAIQNSIEHDRLMEICFAINEDIQQTFKRYDQFKKKTKPNEFISVFLTDYYHLNDKESNKENKSIEDNKVDEGNQKKKINDLNDFFN